MAHTHLIFEDNVDSTPRRAALGRELLAGAEAGLVAGLAMLIAMLAAAFLVEKKPLEPINAIASFVRAEPSIDKADAGTVVLGIVVHELGPALFWGVAFGVLVWAIKPRGSASLLWMGLLVGGIAQVMDVKVFMPQVAALLEGHSPSLSIVGTPNLWTEHISPALSWLVHLVYGLVLSLYPWKYDPQARAFD